MAIRFYIVPKIGDGSDANPYGPAYVEGLSSRWTGMDYGLEPVFLVCADVSPAQHTAITANADVISVPANLSNQIGASLAAAQAALESVNIPANWITSNMTWSTALRGVAIMFMILQRMNGRGFISRFFDSGITLNSTIGDLPQNVRTRLQEAAVSLGANVSSINLSTTLRSALRTVGSQLTLRVLLGGIEL